MPVTAAGIRCCAVVVSPSCPASLSPQHDTPPPTIAHVCSPPAAIAVAPLSPWTAIGSRDGVFELSPSWPLSFAPQHSTSSPTSAHVNSLPATTLRAPVIPGTSTGRVLSRIEPLPSWPWLLRPQHQMLPSGSRIMQVWLLPAAIAREQVCGAGSVGMHTPDLQT